MQGISFVILASVRATSITVINKEWKAYFLGSVINNFLVYVNCDGLKNCSVNQD